VLGGDPSITAISVHFIVTSKDRDPYLNSDIDFFDIGFFNLIGCPADGRSQQVWIEQSGYKRLGRVLAEARNAAGLTQSGLAKKLRKPQSFVSNFESGQRRIDLLEFARIADALGADAQKLFKTLLGGVQRRSS
jgi:hypothetical protein